jgi:hypothetical protein
MKTFKIINISSNGSVYFYHNAEASLSSKLIHIQKQDDKNFSLNQKKIKSNVDSKHSTYYKKKYLK